jgi:hypothetical protein
MIVDDPKVKAEVEAAFARYEAALVGNDVTTLNELFHDDPRTLRYGIAENLYGHAEISGFRAARAPVGLARTWGNNFATACTLFRRPTLPGKIGRQSQTWVRNPAGWKVVAAHVSVIDEPK